MDQKTENQRRLLLRNGNESKIGTKYARKSNGYSVYTDLFGKNVLWTIKYGMKIHDWLSGFLRNKYSAGDAYSAR